MASTADNPQQLRERARLEEGAGRFDEALRCWVDAIERFPDELNLHVGKATTLLRAGRYAEAERAFCAIAERWPNRSAGPIGLVRVIGATQGSERTIAGWRDLSQRFPGQMAILRRLAFALLRSGNLAEAEQVFSEMAGLRPDLPDGRSGLAEVAEARRSWDEALAEWEAIRKEFPESESAEAGAIRTLMQLNRFDEALERCEAAERFGTGFAAVQRSAVLRSDLDFAGARAALLEADPKQVGVSKWAVLMAALQPPDDRLRTLDAARAENPESLELLLRLIEASVRVRDFERALELIDSIDPALDRLPIRKARAWAAARRGKTEEARRLWEPLLAGSRLLSIVGPVEDLDRVDDRRIPDGEGEVRLFSVVRNETLLLPWFLAYYRSLGVERFFFVDNDSDDGTREYLLEQPDVHVFWTDGSYLESESGVRWLNHLIERFGRRSWCLYLDVDEQMVFPGSDGLTLRHLIRYLSERGHEAVRGFMLDMYADPLHEGASYEAGMEPAKACPWFDNRFRVWGQLSAPYVRVEGGMRNRVFMSGTSRPSLGKVPLFRGDREVKLLASSHKVTPVVVSDVTCVLLHFKFLGPYVERFSEEAMRGEHSDQARLYIKYRDQLLIEGRRMSVLCDDSVRYDGVEQLADLGLLEEPAAYRDLVPLPEHLRA